MDEQKQLNKTVIRAQCSFGWCLFEVPFLLAVFGALKFNFKNPAVAHQHFGTVSSGGSEQVLVFPPFLGCT